MSANLKISFRNVVKSDYPYLMELYASTRIDVHLHGGHLSYEQKMDFIKSQFELQDIHYKKFNTKAKFLIVMNNNEKIGRLYKEDLDDQVSIIEFTLHEKVRSQNIGSRIIQDIIEDAHAANKPVVLHAAKDSPEFKFYKKLGFKILDDLGPYFKMTTNPMKMELAVDN